MSFWELFAALASAASIVSLAIAISSIFNGLATRGVVRETSDNTLALIREMQQETHQLLDRMEERTTRILERMDQRAAERHRE